MALIKSCRGIEPQFGEDVYLAENATVVGDVVMGDRCSVWFNAVIRGDVNSILMGNQVNVQDGAVIGRFYLDNTEQAGRTNAAFTTADASITVPAS